MGRILGHLSASRINPAGIKAEVGEEFVSLGVLDVLVGDAEAAEAAGFEVHFAGGFQHGAAEAGHEGAFFHGDEEAGFAEGPPQDVAVEQFDEAGVDDADVEAEPRHLPAASFSQGIEGLQTQDVLISEIAPYK